MPRWGGCDGRCGGETESLYSQRCGDLGEKSLFAPDHDEGVCLGGRHFPEILAKDLANILGILLGVLKEGVEEDVLIEANLFIVQMMIVGIMAFYKTTALLRTKYGILHKKLAAMDQKFPGAGEREIENLVLRALRK